MLGIQITLCSAALMLALWRIASALENIAGSMHKRIEWLEYENALDNDDDDCEVSK